jgi:alkylhydroperoxidase family enzyme
VSWLGTARGDFDSVFGLRPDLHAAWKDFTAIFWEKRPVDPELLELCRLRIARLQRAPACERARTPGVRVDAAKLAALDAWWRSPVFSAVEQACLRFAEQFALDPKGLSDEDARAVVEALGDAGTVAFVQALAIFDGFSRFCAILGVEPAEGT